MSSFGKHLRFLRIQKHLTQKELAHLLNLSPSTIGMYERDEREPDFNTLISIADFFNVSIDFLLAYNLEQKYTFPKLSNSDLSLLLLKVDYPNLFDFISQASEEDLKKLDALISIIK